MHPHRMDNRGSVKHLWAVGNHGCLTHRQEHGTRQLPLWLVAGRCLLALLASGLGSSVGAPSRNLDISKSYILLRPSIFLQGWHFSPELLQGSPEVSNQT
jgi:hypothetical protein